MRKPIGLTAPYREDDDDIQDYKKPWVGLTVGEIAEIAKTLERDRKSTRLNSSH